ncbi:MAG: xanthine dehydrogenase family protein [Candidatus Rokubacteria bacterium]|nr:xanthine dehydrogenase family protein [Candidatus Rokubacteria bacterium]
MGAKYIGAEVKRKEDPRLLRGRGTYVDDVKLPGLLHAAVLRSPHAHARLGPIRTEAALRQPGVVAVFAYDDLKAWLRPLPVSGMPPPALQARVGFTIRTAAQLPLACDRVRYVGEAVAVVVAESRYLAEDALDLIHVEYEPLPAVTSARAALAPGAPLLYPEWGDNVAASFSHAIGDVEAALRRADVIVRETLRVQRYAGMTMECRGVVADPRAREAALTVWDSTQIPHHVQTALAEALRLPAHRVRVIAPDVGGGFGTKANLYPEEILIPLVAWHLGRPVKWIETRREHMQAAIHSREQIHDVEIAAAADGTILALRDRFLVDQGGYNPWGIVQPYNTVAHLLGPFRIRDFAVEAKVVMTNKTPHAPYRGAGRPEAVFVMDRAVDLLARELRLDPAEVRRRNFIRADELPYDVGLLYRDGQPLVYDSADFPGALETALEAVDYEKFRTEQVALRERAVYRGVGLSAYVEGTGVGPYEGAVVRLDSTGGVIVATGAASQGQGHETVFAQICADTLGVPLEAVTVIGGDTGAIPFGVGTFASRSTVLAGNAIAESARKLRDKVRRVAAGLLEASPQDIEIEDGRAFVRGVPASAVTLARVVQSTVPSFARPDARDLDFDATTYYVVPTVTYSSAVHAALVEVDVETGAVTLLRYVVVHDCGRVINPMLVEGQIHGGVAQGIGGALWEELRYDAAGQLLTGTFMEYPVPTAAALPFIETRHQACLSPRNPLGVKGLGEGGAISPPAAIANAVEDALASFGVRVTACPLTPANVHALIAAARGR